VPFPVYKRMSQVSVESLPVTPAVPRRSFLRESGWLMMANIGGGILNFFVHPLAKSAGPAADGIFAAFLAVTICIPTMPLQLVFAQQTASSIAKDRQRQLVGFIRVAWLISFLIWLLFAIVAIVAQDTIVQRWKLPNPTALWITLPMVLFSIWVPVFSGVL